MAPRNPNDPLDPPSDMTVGEAQEGNTTPVGVLSNPDLVGQHGAFECVHATKEELESKHEAELERQRNRTDAGQ